MTQKSIDLTEVVTNAFESTASAQRTACYYAGKILQYPGLLDAIVTANDGQGHFAFTALPSTRHDELSVTVIAPNLQKFVLTNQWGNKVRTQPLGVGKYETNDFGTYDTYSPTDAAQSLVKWCGERTPPAFLSSLRANLARVQETEKQRQAGINAGLAEEGLAQHVTGSDAIPTDPARLTTVLRHHGFVGQVGSGGTDGAGQGPTQV